MIYYYVDTSALVKRYGRFTYRQSQPSPIINTGDGVDGTGLFPPVSQGLASSFCLARKPIEIITPTVKLMTKENPRTKRGSLGKVDRFPNRSTFANLTDVPQCNIF